MTTCALYLRVSSREQREEGASLDEQREMLTRYAGRHNLSITTIYEEDASTWKSGRRDEFSRMVEDAYQGKFQRILVQKLDRFARTQREIHTTIDKLEQAGVFLILAQEGTDFSRIGRHARSAIRGGLAMGAEMEALAKSDRAIMVNEYRRQQLRLFTTGRLPTGYVAAETRYQPARVDTLRAEGVKVAFRLYATGDYSITGLATELRQRGYTLSGGGPYTENAVRHILKNRRYTGRVLVDDEWIASNETALISDDLFEQVQRMLALRHSAPRTAAHKFRSHLLNGILYCSHCGSKMYIRNQAAYICQLTRLAGDNCPVDDQAPKLITEGLLARQVDALIGHLELKPGWKERTLEIVNQGDEGRDIEAERQRVSAALWRVKELFIMGDLLLDQYVQKRQELTQRLHSLVVPESNQEAVLQAGAYLENLPSLWAEATIREQRAILCTIFSALWLDRVQRQIVRVSPFPEFQPLFTHLEFEPVDGSFLWRHSRGSARGTAGISNSSYSVVKEHTS